MWYLHIVHRSNVASASGLGKLRGCLAADGGFPAAAEGRSRQCSIVAEMEEREAIGPTQCSQTTFSRLESPSQAHPALFCVVGIPKSLAVHFPRETWLCTARLPAWPPTAAARSLPVPRRPESLAILLLEVTSQLLHGLGFL